MIKNILNNRTTFLVVTILLSAFGVMAQHLAFTDFYQQRFPNNILFSYGIMRFLIYFLIGWAFFIIVQFTNIKHALKYKWVWLGLSLALAILTTYIGIEINGLKRFINIGGIVINSGYWILLFYVFYLVSRKNANYKGELSQSKKTSNISIISEIAITAVLLIWILLFMEKQIFIALIIVIIIDLFLINKKRWAMIIAIIILTLFAYPFITNHHFSNRMEGYYTHSWKSHQVKQCLNSFEYGGLFGIGFNKTQRTLSNRNLLPESLGHTSFAVVIEHFGIIGGILLISLFTYFVYYGLRVYMRNKEDSDAFLLPLLLSVFIVFNLAHVMNCLNLFPFGSMLSFFSVGRDFNIISLITAGLIFKYGARSSWNDNENIKIN